MLVFSNTSASLRHKSLQCEAKALSLQPVNIGMYVFRIYIYDIITQIFRYAHKYYMNVCCFDYYGSKPTTHFLSE